MELSVVIQFARLVADSEDSVSVFSFLAQTVVDRCGAVNARVFGIGESGDFEPLAEAGLEGNNELDPSGTVSVADLHEAAARTYAERFDLHTFPMISDARLFGALVVLWPRGHASTGRQWQLVEGLSELTAISLAKAYQQRKLQDAFDNLRASQETLLRTEKVRALGQMAAGIAHDLRNLLTPLVLYCDEMQDPDASPGKVKRIARSMDTSITRGLQTVERLRDFSRQSPEEDEGEPTDLNIMVSEALEICRPRLAGIRLAVVPGTPPPAVLRPSDCVTAVVNLLVNAAEALNGRGSISVTTGSTDGGAFIEVADDGPGIPAGLKDKIFEPFFTTKGNAGTGLGIAIVQSFAERYGGRLTVDSEPGRGARFTLWFPTVP